MSAPDYSGLKRVVVRIIDGEPNQIVADEPCVVYVIHEDSSTDDESFVRVVSGEAMMFVLPGAMDSFITSLIDS